MAVVSTYYNNNILVLKLWMRRTFWDDQFGITVAQFLIVLDLQYDCSSNVDVDFLVFIVG